MGILDGPESLIGTRVLDFELVRVLGTGGMSVVYKAQHVVTGQVLAAKVLPPELALHQDLKLRFVEEAKALALLDHPNIVALNNFTEDTTGRLWLMMQYIEGNTLEQRIKADDLAVADILQIAIEVAKALEYAHGRGVIHRDMKPSNILLRYDGAVKVTDFGIAKIIGSTRLTHTGQTMGTVRYMSPEQVRGKAVDGRSDLYSLGVTLYEAFSGDTPFVAETPFEVMQQHLTVPPPSLRSVGLPVELEQAVMRALEKNVEARYAHAAEFRAALECFTTGTPIYELHRGNQRSPRRRAKRWAIAGAVLLALGGAGLLLGGRFLPAVPRPLPRPTRRDVEWPPPHLHLRALPVAADQRFSDTSVRILSLEARDLVPLRDRVARARSLFPPFLRDAGIATSQSVAQAPINLGIVPQSFLDRHDLWPDLVKGKPSPPVRYLAPFRTLYVADSPGYEDRDLIYGLGLHFCALLPIDQVSNAQMVDLAERFERYWAAHKD